MYYDTEYYGGWMVELFLVFQHRNLNVLPCRHISKLHSSEARAGRYTYKCIIKLSSYSASNVSSTNRKLFKFNAIL